MGRANVTSVFFTVLNPNQLVFVKWKMDEIKATRQVIRQGYYGTQVLHLVPVIAPHSLLWGRGGSHHPLKRLKKVKQFDLSKVKGMPRTKGIGQFFCRDHSPPHKPPPPPR